MSRKAWTALAGMILGGTAHAAVISTGLGLGGGECNVANVGTKPVTVKSVTFIDGKGDVHSPGSSNCTFPGPISPGTRTPSRLRDADGRGEYHGADGC